MTGYNADGNVAQVTAVNRATGDQVTRFVYGTTLVESQIASSFLKRYDVFPDATGICSSSSSSSSSSGSSSSGICDQVAYAYNRQGEVTSKADQNGTVHEYDYDLLGRHTADRVTTLGSGVDGAVRRISTTYEVRGMPETITSYDNAVVGQGAIVNDVRRGYNDFGQLVTEYQSHAGVVDVATTPRCQYRYADGDANTVRPTALVYPSGRVLNNDYGVAGGMNDCLGRIASLIDDDGVTHLCDYTYLGLSSVVQSNSPQPNLTSTLIGVAGGNDPVTGDIYRGLDAFGRVKDLIWTARSGSSSSGSSSSSGPAGVVERVQHGYDWAGNRVWRAELADPARQHDEYYTYDGLNRLRRLDRGSLNSAKTGITNKTFAQCWTLDSTGNWRQFRQDNDGNGLWDLVQLRTANKVNEITSITAPASLTGGLPLALPSPLGTANTMRNSWIEPAYDGAGNMTTMPQPTLPMSGYNATYDAWNRIVKVTAGGENVGLYEYDGVQRRMIKQMYSGGVLTETRHYYYSSDWQILEEQLSGSSSAERQYVWGLRYVDDIVLRDRDMNAEGMLSERLYGLQDSNWNLTALSDKSGSVQERYEYDAYGNPTTLTPGFGLRIETLLSWETRYGGYRWDMESALYHVRERYYHPRLGCWQSRDPVFVGDSHPVRPHSLPGLLILQATNLYGVVALNPVNATDPFGLAFPFTPPVPPAPVPVWGPASPIPPAPAGCAAALPGPGAGPAAPGTPWLPIAAPPILPFGGGAGGGPGGPCGIYLSQCWAGWAYGCNAFWACAVGSTPRPWTVNNPIVGVYANPPGSANCARGCLQNASSQNGMGPPVPAIVPPALTCYCIYWFHLDCFRRCSFWPPWPFNFPLFAAQCSCPCGVVGLAAANINLGLWPGTAVVRPPPNVACVPIPPGVPPPGTGTLLVP